jgi:hypothetical protein
VRDLALFTGDVESIPRDVLCPRWIGEDPDGGTCQSAVTYHLDSGTINGVDVSRLTVAGVVFIPGNILAGNFGRCCSWTTASDEQERTLLDAFTALGGPLADLAQLVGERLAVIRRPDLA